jgi:type II secretory ATPase GspE/PulE/Tfp pilus assembly ATPase PilB-like protein
MDNFLRQDSALDRGVQGQDFLSYLIFRGILDPCNRKRLMQENPRCQDHMVSLCVSLGFVSAEAMASVTAQWSSRRGLNLESQVCPSGLLEKLTLPFCQKACLCPLVDDQGMTWVVMADVGEVASRDHVRRILGSVRFWEAPQEMIEAILARSTPLASPHFGDLLATAEAEEWGGASGGGGVSALSFEIKDHPIVRFVEGLLREGVRVLASDIHLEPEGDFVRVRFRCDGLLRTVFAFHPKSWGAILVRLKLIADLNIVETRAPQSGRARLMILGRMVDFRISSHPVIDGENVVIRILAPLKTELRLSSLGYEAGTQAAIETALKRPDGLFLVTGPTGSGKTTSLYAFLTQLSPETRNIMTLEEPVEYARPCVRQTSIREQGDFGFAEGVRSILRQDPDVILIGEIRDPQTAHMALRAAMTGHQVLSTLHTSDALSAVFRMMELGLEAPFLAGHLRGVLSQRLVRLLCRQCKIPQKIQKDFGSIPYGTDLIFEAAGCSICSGTGYQGRQLIAELIQLNPEFDGWLLTGKDRRAAEQILRRHNHYRTLWESGLSLVFRGETSLLELERVLGDVSFSIPWEEALLSPEGFSLPNAPTSTVLQ